MTAVTTSIIIEPEFSYLNSAARQREEAVTHMQLRAGELSVCLICKPDNQLTNKSACKVLSKCLHFLQIPGSQFKAMLSSDWIFPPGKIRQIPWMCLNRSNCQFLWGNLYVLPESEVDKMSVSQDVVLYLSQLCFLDVPTLKPGEVNNIP